MSVGFADLANFAKLLDTVDTPRAIQILRDAFKTAGDFIIKFNGQIHKYHILPWGELSLEKYLLLRLDITSKINFDKMVFREYNLKRENYTLNWRKNEKDKR